MRLIPVNRQSGFTETKEAITQNKHPGQPSPPPPYNGSTPVISAPHRWGSCRVSQNGSRTRTEKKMQQPEQQRWFFSSGSERKKIVARHFCCQIEPWTLFRWKISSSIASWNLVVSHSKYLSARWCQTSRGIFSTFSALSREGQKKRETIFLPTEMKKHKWVSFSAQLQERSTCSHSQPSGSDQTAVAVLAHKNRSRIHLKTGACAASPGQVALFPTSSLLLLKPFLCSNNPWAS